MINIIHRLFIVIIISTLFFNTAALAQSQNTNFLPPIIDFLLTPNFDINEPPITPFVSPVIFDTPTDAIAFTVPNGVNSLRVFVQGASGADASGASGPYPDSLGPSGGRGGRGETIGRQIAVIPNEVFVITVGAAGIPSAGGGGGGGRSAVTRSNGLPLIVAGGGGGGGATGIANGFELGGLGGSRAPINVVGSRPINGTARSGRGLFGGGSFGRSGTILNGEFLIATPQFSGTGGQGFGSFGVPISIPANNGGDGSFPIGFDFTSILRAADRSGGNGGAGFGRIGDGIGGGGNGHPNGGGGGGGGFTGGGGGGSANDSTLGGGGGGSGGSFTNLNSPDDFQINIDIDINIVGDGSVIIIF